MNSRHPPRLATWLLTHFAVNDALVGDLVEAYEGRRRVWFWKQALIALATQAGRDI